MDRQKKRLVMWLSLSRIFVAPIIALLLFAGKNVVLLPNGGEYVTGLGCIPTFYARIIAIIVMICAELTDALDGYFARKYNVVSDMGKVLDPFADSVYRFSLFASFALMGYLPLWALLAFFYRDSLSSFMRILSALKGVAMGARISGKLKTLFNGIVCFGALALDLLRYNPIVRIDIPYQTIISSAFSLAAIFALISGVDYFIASRPLWKTDRAQG